MKPKYCLVLALTALLAACTGNSTVPSSSSAPVESSQPASSVPAESSSESLPSSESVPSSESSSSSEESSSSETSVDEWADYQESDQRGKMLFPRGNIGQRYIGDPMPYVENGKMYAFYLEDARNYRGAFHPISMMETEDFLTYTNYDRVIPFENSKQAVDYALGTGSCIKGPDGTYHFYYTGHNDRSDSGLPFYEKIQHATSTDLIHWTKHPADGFYGDGNDFRDPHVVYIEELGEYWMLVTQMVSALGTLRRYTSTDLVHWTDQGVWYRNTKGIYNMECSTLIRYKGYWYLSFSEQGKDRDEHWEHSVEPGKHRVVHYRYKKNLSDDWIVPEVDYLDDEGFYAGKIAGDDEHLYLYGWCGTKSRSADTGTFGWGGNLVGHELFQKENGELGIKPMEKAKQNMATHYPHHTADGELVKSIAFDGVGYQTLKFEPFKQDRFARVEFDYTPATRAGTSGIMLGMDADKNYGKLAYRFSALDQTISFHNNVVSENDLGAVDVEIPYQFEARKTYKIELYYNDQVCALYVNGDVALTARTYAAKDKSFAFFSKERKCTFENIKFYE